MRKAPLILKLSGRDPDKRHVRKAAELCKKGRIIAFPTETVYVVGGRMTAPGIEKRLREITGRPVTESFVYHVSDWPMLDALGVEKTPLVCTLARQFWPGPVTLIVSNLAGRKMRIRFPRNRIALALIRETGEPLVTVGANQLGKSSPHTAHQVQESLQGDLDCLVDGGRTEVKPHATVVDATGEVPVILCKGAQGTEVEKGVLRTPFESCPRKRILVICTGNLCRSPMAEGWLKREIEERGLSGEIEVISCGTHARDGVPCTPETESLMRERGIDLHKFRGRLCRGGDLWSSDLILAMAPKHAREIAKILPSVKDRTITLNVEDPIGKGMDVYEKVFLDIETKMKRRLDAILRLQPVGRDRRKSTQDRRQRKEERRKKTEAERQHMEDRRRRAEDRRQRAEDRRLKTEPACRQAGTEESNFYSLP